MGTVTNFVFTWSKGDNKLVVDYSELPHFAVDFAGADTIYEHVKGALLKQTLSKPLSYADL